MTSADGGRKRRPRKAGKAAPDGAAERGAATAADPAREPGRPGPKHRPTAVEAQTAPNLKQPRIRGPHQSRNTVRPARAGASAPALAPGARSVSWEPVRRALAEVFAARYRWHRRGGWRPLAPEEAPLEGRGGARTRPPWKTLRRDIEALHEVYTGAGGEFHGDQNPIHRHMGGYQFYYLPRNAFRVLHVLHSLPWAPGGIGSWRTGKGFSVLDLGAGSGAFSVGVLMWLAAIADRDARPAELDVQLVDQGHALLELAKANLHAVARVLLPEVRLRVRTRAHGIARELTGNAPAAAYTLAGGAMVLNELQGLAAGRREQRNVALFDSVRRLVRPGGALVFVEPGTRKGYLNMMGARSALEGTQMLYPCPHGEECPMFEPQVRRWCHATVRLPDDFGFDDSLRREGGLRLAMREVNLAALAVQVVDGARPAPPFRETRGLRVVSAPLPPRKQKARAASAEPTGGAPVLLTCGPDGRLREVPAAEHPGSGRGGWVPLPGKGQPK